MHDKDVDRPALTVTSKPMPVGSLALRGGAEISRFAALRSPRSGRSDGTPASADARHALP